MNYYIKNLAGPLLDYAVFQAERQNGIAVSKPVFVNASVPDPSRDWYSPSMKAEHCWPIIERTSPTIGKDGGSCWATLPNAINVRGPTYLIAFCKAYAISVLGPDLNFPGE